MLTQKQSRLFFLFGCIPVRIGLAYLASQLSEKYLPYLGIVLIIISLSFAYLYFSNKRLNAPEAGGNTWWSEYRLIHSALYLVAGIYALQQKNIAWIPLAIDVAFGACIFSFNL